MSRRQFTGPKLPRDLLSKVNASDASTKRHGSIATRKDRRKADRHNKKAARVNSSREQHGNARTRPHHSEQRDRQPSTSARSATPSVTASKQPVKSILKRPATASLEKESESDLEESELADSDSDDDSTAQAQSLKASKASSREDAEIAALEKKLRLKGKKSSALEDDGLDWIIDGSDSDGDNARSDAKRKRSEEDDAWLGAKRSRAGAMSSVGQDEVASLSDGSLQDDSDDVDDQEDSEGDGELDSEMDGLENPFSDDELSSDDFDSDEDEAPPKPKVRENPYVAPVSKSSSAKYIPPSMRKSVDIPAEDLTQLKRQVQGQLNRLSEANFLSILQSIEQILEKNARQHVFTVLIELLHGLVSSPSVLNETFLILHAGFATAAYKVMGVDFGAAFLEKITESIKVYTNGSAQGKELLNLVGFLSNLYVSQMVGSTIIFDYIRQFLQSMSEDNTELLLRIVRTAGVQLRQDDPSSLKDIVVLLTRSVAEMGEQNLTVRTKFMIETITDLKNNRMKTGASTTGVASEHAVRVKKIVGTLNTRSLRASEPLQISLADIEDSEKKGKWWLVGASYQDPAKLARDKSASSEVKKVSASTDDGYESETPGHVSLQKLARTQGMNTDIRRAIFTAIMSASDYQDAHLRIMKLHLKNKQAVEVPKILLQCAAAEKVYNPYYTIIATKLCGNDKKMQKSFQFTLRNAIRNFEGEQDEEESDATSTNGIVNTAQLYGALLAAQQLPLTALKTLDFTYMSPMLQMFAEVLLTSIFLRIHKTSKATFDEQVKTVFAQASAAPQMLSALQLFLQTTISGADMANSSQEKKTIQRGSTLAIQSLTQAASMGDSHDDSSDNISD